DTAAGVKCEQLTQPASLTVQPGQRLTITCQVSYSVSSYYTAWIRQPAGKGLEWMSSDSSVKDSLKNKFSVDLDSSSNTVTLNGQNVQPEDTAVYYCARDTQQHKPSVDLNKNPSVPLMISHQFTVTVKGETVFFASLYFPCILDHVSLSGFITVNISSFV
uniref:Ig-like domain-containing protein n=1 Tax=Lates calcarifer TaxID=8187 RepID=A0A4W6ECZ2_LATCA